MCSDNAACWNMILKCFMESSQSFCDFFHNKHSSGTSAEPIPGGQAGQDSQGVHGSILAGGHHHTGRAGEEQGGGAGEWAACHVGVVSYRQRWVFPEADTNKVEIFSGSHDSERFTTKK